MYKIITVHADFNVIGNTATVVTCSYYSRVEIQCTIITVSITECTALTDQLQLMYHYKCHLYIFVLQCHLV